MIFFRSFIYDVFTLSSPLTCARKWYVLFLCQQCKTSMVPNLFQISCDSPTSTLVHK